MEVVWSQPKGWAWAVCPPPTRRRSGLIAVLRYSSIQSAEGMADAEFFWLCWLPGYTRALAILRQTKRHEISRR